VAFRDVVVQRHRGLFQHAQQVGLARRHLCQHPIHRRVARPLGTQIVELRLQPRLARRLGLRAVRLQRLVQRPQGLAYPFDRLAVGFAEGHEAV
jgi:hypothetical protein